MHQLHLYEFLNFGERLSLHTSSYEFDTDLSISFFIQNGITHRQDQLSEILKRPILSYCLIIVNFIIDQPVEEGDKRNSLLVSASLVRRVILRPYDLQSNSNSIC